MIKLNIKMPCDCNTCPFVNKTPIKGFCSDRECRSPECTTVGYKFIGCSLVSLDNIPDKGRHINCPITELESPIEEIKEKLDNAGEKTKNALIEEYSKYDKDLRLLSYKILLEKFNTKMSVHNKSPELVLFEWYTAAEPALKSLAKTNPEIKISIHLGLKTLIKNRN